MAHVIGLVTDSSSQITVELVERFAVEVVPLTVTIDGDDYLEGVDLDADGFYARYAAGASPAVATSQPAPGRFAEAYGRLAEAGADEIVSIHISRAMSGTVASATLAAVDAPVPVSVIDTGSASFGVSVCTWAAGVAIGRGANVADIQRRIGGLVPRIATAFMVGVPSLTERGSRAEGVDLSDDDGIPILVLERGELRILERVSSIDDTIDVMSTYASEWDDDVTVAIGTADEPSRSLTTRLAGALEGAASVSGVVHYRVGPSVGAHTGPGTFGLFVFPTIR